MCFLGADILSRVLRTREALYQRVFDLRENTRCYSLHSKPLSFHGTWLLHSATDRRSFKSTRQVRAHADSCSGDGYPHRPSRSQWS